MGRQRTLSTLSWSTQDSDPPLSPLLDNEMYHNWISPNDGLLRQLANSNPFLNNPPTTPSSPVRGNVTPPRTPTSIPPYSPLAQLIRDLKASNPIDHTSYHYLTLPDSPLYPSKRSHPPSSSYFSRRPSEFSSESSQGSSTSPHRPLTSPKSLKLPSPSSHRKSPMPPMPPMPFGSLSPNPLSLSSSSAPTKHHHWPATSSPLSPAQSSFSSQRKPSTTPSSLIPTSLSPSFTSAPTRHHHWPIPPSPRSPAQLPSSSPRKPSTAPSSPYPHSLSPTSMSAPSRHHHWPPPSPLRQDIDVYNDSLLDERCHSTADDGILGDWVEHTVLKTSRLRHKNALLP